jgi:hypothetical protein
MSDGTAPKAGFPQILATRTDVTSPRMVHMIEAQAGDWHRLDELSADIETLVQHDPACQRSSLFSCKDSPRRRRSRTPDRDKRSLCDLNNRFDLTPLSISGCVFPAGRKRRAQR